MLLCNVCVYDDDDDDDDDPCTKIVFGFLSVTCVHCESNGKVGILVHY